MLSNTITTIHTKDHLITQEDYKKSSISLGSFTSWSFKVTVILHLTQIQLHLDAINIIYTINPLLQNMWALFWKVAPIDST